MPGNQISFLYSRKILIHFLFIFYLRRCDSRDEVGASNNTYFISSFQYPRTRVGAYDAEYIRVELPLWFSSVSLSVESDVNLDINNLNKSSTSIFQIICVREGSRPVPDLLDGSYVSSGSISNISLVDIQDSQNVKCNLMQNHFILKFSNEEITPGIWYFALHNGIGNKSAQSKMIVRHPSYTYTANITVKGCTSLTKWGRNCNQSIQPLSCSQIENESRSQLCVSEKICQETGEHKIYSLDILSSIEEVIFKIQNLTSETIEANLTAFVRFNGLPTPTNYTYFHIFNSIPLTINLPKIGRWYILLTTTLDRPSNVCYSIECQAIDCPIGKAGKNCTQKKIELQTFIQQDSTQYESFFVPINEGPLSDPKSFLVSSTGLDDWNFYLLKIPTGVAGGHIHVHLTSEVRIKHEVYVRYGSMPSLENWDFNYINRSRHSNDSMFFVSYSESDDEVDFYILSVKEGTWSIGLRPIEANIDPNLVTTMSVSLEGCPNKCSSNGRCSATFDTNRLTYHSFCSCDRTHGGFDCGVEIVSHRGHIIQSFSLIFSNIAAALPAFWSLKNKAYAEWVLFTSSGVSSALYHACDVGTWCALSFNVLQFMDFWLSFMAVVTTFVSLTTIDESAKRTIHVIVAMVTALMAITKATRTSNIALVIAIGALGLIVGWVMEFSTARRCRSGAWGCNVALTWHNVNGWVRTAMKRIVVRFRWGFVIGGFVALGMSALSWQLENSDTYWLWHSLWHLSVYTCSFLFLCSKADLGRETNDVVNSYELTRQRSFNHDNTNNECY